MKIQIRQGVFETNSSSVHSMVMLSSGDYDRWIKGATKYNIIDENFLPTAEANEYNDAKFKENENYPWCEKPITSESYLRDCDVDIYLSYDEFMDIYLNTAEVVEDELNGVHAISYYKYD